MKYIMLISTFMLASVYGNGCGNKKTVFQCPVKSGKILTVCGEDNQLFYRFGKIGKSPEKNIQQSISQVDYKLWDGVGSAAKQSIDFNKDAYHYRVFSQYQRLLNGKPTQRADVDADVVPSGGVQVIQNDKIIATVDCDSYKMLDNIENYKLGEPLKKPKTNESCSKTVFSCTTENKRFVKVCKTATDYTYQYGKAGEKPELTIKRRHDDVIKEPWNGLGHHLNQSLGFRNNDVIYWVFSSLERKVGGRWSGGIVVGLPKKEVRISCDKNSMQQDLVNETAE